MRIERGTQILYIELITREYTDRLYSTHQLYACSVHMYATPKRMEWRMNDVYTCFIFPFVLIISVVEDCASVLSHNFKQDHNSLVV